MATIIDALAASVGFDPKRFAVDSIAAAASLGQMAQNLGISTERLTAWQKAAERAGGTAEAISAQLRESAGQISKFNRGQAADSVPAFLQNGGNVSDLRDGNTYLLARSRIIADLYQKDRSRAAQVAEEMGVNEALFDLFRRGPVELEKLLQAQERRSAVSAQDADAAARLRDRYLDLRDTFESVAMRILVALIPAFERALEVLQGWGDWFLENEDVIAKWVDGTAKAVVAFIDVVDAAAQAVGGWQNALLALGALKILSWANSLLGLASALREVAFALAALGGAGASKGLAALRGVGAAALRAAGRIGAGVALALYSEDLNVGETQIVRAHNDPALRTKEVGDAVRFFERKGYSLDEAAGLAAHLQIQSGFDPRADAEDGRFYGIALWDRARQADFRQAIGVVIEQSTLEQQLEFVDWELRNSKRGAREKLAESTNAAQAGVAAYRYFGLDRYQAIDAADARKRELAAPVIAGVADMERREQASAAAASITSAAQAGAIGAASNNTTTTTTYETHIHGPITIVTPATDGPGLARELGTLGDSQRIVQQANSGIF
ncbi:hypothetical protein LMG26690_03590 [Achromobacter animicus]|uniref:Phage tail lysozyme domain-containing protein n=1 Tax=Achromobacter animicus TaxID=1389935 RepID=A0A6S7A775_9BURK|nr:phage tail tip lysozyme [Achromobacter animicus]CAB3717007.1 hypothetical protein LMG26690_03590 [Achromobacter animicus]